jgi:hypothetical protein
LDVSWDYPVSVFSISYSSTSDHTGDSLEMHIAPNTTIGAIVAPVTTGDTVLYVSPTVLQYINVGYYCNITDGTNYDDLGYVLAIDKTAGTITVKTPAVNGYSPLTPTYVQMTIKAIVNYTFGAPGKFGIGKTIIGSRYVPTGTIVRGVYTNASATTSKSLTFNIEMKY